MYVAPPTLLRTDTLRAQKNSRMRAGLKGSPKDSRIVRLADGYGATEAFDVMLSDADGETKRIHNTLGVAQDVEHLAQLLAEKFGRTKSDLKAKITFHEFAQCLFDKSMVGHSLMFERESRLKTWLVDLIEAGKLWDVTDAPEEVDLSCDNNNDNNDDDDNDGSGGGGGDGGLLAEESEFDTQASDVPFTAIATYRAQRFVKQNKRFSIGGRKESEEEYAKRMRSIALDGVRKRGDNRPPAHQAMLDTAYGTAARKAFQEHFGSDEPKAKKVIRTEFKPGSATRVFYVMYHEVGYGKPTYKWIEEDAMLAMEGNILEEFMAVCAFNDNDNNVCPQHSI